MKEEEEDLEKAKAEKAFELLKQKMKETRGW
jgi:hypothetical protein